MSLVSQLINDISRVLQKLLTYFNDTIISTSFILPLAGALPISITNSETVKLSFHSSL